MLAALFLALQAAPEAPPPPLPPPSLLLVEVVRPARYIGTPRICEEPDENGEMPICMMELYEADVRVLRRWHGPDIGQRVTIRFTAHSFRVVWQSGVRFILATRPFEDQGRSGHFANYWDWEDDGGRFCKDADTIARFDHPPLQQVYERGRLRTVPHDTDGWSRGSVIRCITGTERAPR